MSYTLPAIKALGTVWWIELFSEMPEIEKQVVYSNLLLFIDNFENKYSRFKSESIVTKLNNTGSIENLDQMTIDLFSKGQDLYKKTEGLFNFLLGETLENRGYDANYSFKPKGSLPTNANPLIDLEISDEIITLRQGKIDLGGFGKGYLIDLLAEELKNTYHLPYFLINGGGDIYATTDNDVPITIYLEHPTKPETYIGTTTLKNQGFAASSPHKRQWVVDNKKYNHIISPKNEIVIDGSFIKATTAYEADAFATTVLLLETTKIPYFAEKHHIDISYMPANEPNLFSTLNW